ncbi:MAG: histidine kinase [Gemmatimonadaceae bacterium]
MLRSFQRPETDSASGRSLGRAAAWMLVPAGWLLAALVSSSQGGMRISEGRAIPMPWLEIFTDALYDYAWWAAFTPVIILAVRRIESPRPTTRRIAGHVLLGTAVIASHFLLRAWVALPGDTVHLSRSWRGFRSGLPSALGLYLLVAAGAALYVSSRRARERDRDAAALALRTSRLETQLVEAQLGVLRAQLHPHFLFNALHAVSALIDWKPREARRMLTQLSDLLRMALDFSDLREVPLTREVEWLEHYLELQQARFAERLVVHLRIAPSATAALVPPLVLQPLVENAIKHGIETRPEGGRVEIIAERDGRWLRLRVVNDGTGLDSTASPGVGLRNTRDRLRALYGDDHQVVLRPNEPVGVEAYVELPFRTVTMETMPLNPARDASNA